MAKQKKKFNFKSFYKSNLLTYAILALMFVFVVIWSELGLMSSLFRGLLVPLCTYSILAVSLNLVVGILGDLSLGHAGFMCVGAYASSFFSVLLKNTFEPDWLRFLIALLLGGVAAGIFGLLIGIPVLRLKGDYLAIVTLAFGEIIKNVVNILYVGVDSNGIHVSAKDQAALNLGSDGRMIIKGALGITGTPKDSTFLIGFILLFITVAVSLNLINSRTGRAVMSIRDNRIAAQSVGINITKYKLIIFAVSAFFAGIAGVLYSHNLNALTAKTSNFGYNMSITILVFVVLGGIGNIRGSFIAAIVLTALPELLRGLEDYRMLIYAILLIVMMIVRNSEKLGGAGGKLTLKKFSENRKNGKMKKGGAN